MDMMMAVRMCLERAKYALPGCGAPHHLFLAIDEGADLRIQKLMGVCVGTRIVDQHKIGSEKNPTDTLVNNGSHPKQKLLR
jgi:hypothetical protein